MKISPCLRLSEGIGFSCYKHAPDGSGFFVLFMLMRAGIILLVGAGAGLVYNGLSASGIPFRTPEEVSFEELADWDLHVEGMRVSLSEAKAAFDRQEAVFVDARSHQEYVAGHIPGALSLPASEFEARGQVLLKGVPKGSRLITYCSGEHCQSSILLAKVLIERLGYARTQVFFDGWHAWNARAYPFVIGDAP